MSGVNSSIPTDRIVSVKGPAIREFPDWGLSLKTTACEFQLLPPTAFELHYQLPRYLLVHLFTGARGRSAVGDGAIVPRTLKPRSSCVLAPETRMRLIQDDPIEYLAIAIDPCRFMAIADRAVGVEGWQLEGMSSFIDPALDSLCREMRRALMAEKIGHAVYMEALVEAVLTRLASKFLIKEETVLSEIEGLSPFLMRKIVSEVDARLETGIKASDLAEVSGLSRAHFTRAFTQSFGEPPGRYILGCRVARARQLLSDTTASITEIAMQCGFANPSHITTVFQKELGLSPKDYRRAVMPQAS